MRATKLIAALTLVGFAGAAMAQTVLKAADVHPDGYPPVVAIQNLGKKLETETKGRLKIQMFNNSALGDEKSTIEQTQAGAIDINRISLGAVGAVVPETNVFNMPFIFRDEAHMHAVVDGPIGQEILDKITASSANLVALGFMDGGVRNMVTKKAINTPADLKGLKIRVIGNPIFLDMANALGANGISMPYGEVYTGLQTGVIDGAENNEPSYYTQNWYQSHKFYSLTGHLIVPEIFVFSKKKWDALSKEDQALVKKFSREAQLEQRALWDKSVADYTGKLKAAGIQFIDVDQKPFFDATAPVRAKYGAKFADLMKRIGDVK